MPCSTPGEPRLSVAAVRPGVPPPSPPASQPTSRTPASGMKAWNTPMALEPPPTHATTTSGSLPVRSRTCWREPPPPRPAPRPAPPHDVGEPARQVEALLAGLHVDDPLEVPHHHRERVRAAH